ncbi:hypothetical protein FGSG_02108 [Fusarium graminearum PH-1]|uniref:hypothetical protein n=1 Tax=Gibberella zeae (strain ATCC MYA-4620 / CBS 123657 / FGSC 9075 / NRRL 31084 / PH-1) TaxID=229533 RepID=UPI000023D68D|nr:hypothetical protein FGSG_02108 [Fusarium graminearum PH-1]ESU07499.1 hypothetical protein FGSG_02108 [Fusarium graminearum PH-1]EYB25969.1 hypothetical protein FG05_02108 [Fusarium graminearum]|eukprot:XP_011317984.1 hypothetical protein FGSG_02108 [Fusarium graminearum PH-1]
MSEQRPPFPPFSRESAHVKVKAAQDGWNTHVTKETHPKSKWPIPPILSGETAIAVQFWYEFRDDEGQWWRCYGLEDWTFDNDGLMKKRQMSGNNVKISEEERWFKEGVDVNTVEIGPEHW